MLSHHQDGCLYPLRLIRRRAGSRLHSNASSPAPFRLAATCSNRPLFGSYAGGLFGT